MSLVPRHTLFDFDNFFDHFWSPTTRNGAEHAEAAFTPRVEVKESDNHYLINAELPGVDKKDIQVTLNNGVLCIQAESEQEDKEEKDGKIIRQERRYGKFMRSFNLNSNVQESDIEASFKNGVLTLKAPKSEPASAQTRQITIQ